MVKSKTFKQLFNLKETVKPIIYIHLIKTGGIFYLLIDKI